MGVQRDAVVRGRASRDSRIRSRLTENGEHGATTMRSIAIAAGVVLALDHALRVGEDRRLVLDARGPAAGRPGSRRRSSSRAPRGSACRSRAPPRSVVEPHAVREDVEMVARSSCSRTAAARPSRSASRRASSPASAAPRSGRAPSASRTARRPAPPARAVSVWYMWWWVLTRPGHHHVAASVDHLVGGRGQIGRRADRVDHVVAHEHAAAGNLAPLGVHRDQQPASRISKVPTASPRRPCEPARRAGAPSVCRQRKPPGSGAASSRGRTRREPAADQARARRR